MREHQDRSDLKKKCPYCGKVVNASGLNGHVLNSSDDVHGDFQKTPEGFDPGKVETFVKEEEKTARTKRSITLNNRLYLCNYCNELTKGSRGFKNHLNQRAGDVLHPNEGEIEDNEYTTVPADEDWNPIMDLDDVYRIQKHRRKRGEIVGQVTLSRVLNEDEPEYQVATIIENRPELENEPERVMAITGANEEQFKKGVKLSKDRN